MFILRKLFKILLLPVVFVLFFIKWLLATSLKLTESIVGLLTMIVGGGIIYYLVCKRWSDVFLMSLIFAAIMVLLFAVITVQDWCDVLIEKNWRALKSACIKGLSRTRTLKCFYNILCFYLPCANLYLQEA